MGFDAAFALGLPNDKVPRDFPDEDAEIACVNEEEFREAGETMVGLRDASKMALCPATVCLGAGAMEPNDAEEEEEIEDDCRGTYGEGVKGEGEKVCWVMVPKCLWTCKSFELAYGCRPGMEEL